MAAQLATLDKELGGIEPGRKFDGAELRRTVRFQSLMRDYQRAVAAGKPATELAKLESEAAPLAPKGFKFEDYRGNFSLQRTWQDYYRAVTGKGDAAQVASLTGRLELIESNDVETQNEIAWTLLTDESIKTRNVKLALKFAQAACNASNGKNADVLDTYARALADNGKPAEAARQLERAIELTSDATRKAELQAALKNYTGTVEAK
jgi:predicted Zn-dependent protease